MKQTGKIWVGPAIANLNGFVEGVGCPAGGVSLAAE